MHITLLGNCQMGQLKNLLHADDSRHDITVVDANTDISEENLYKLFDRSDVVLTRIYGSGVKHSFMEYNSIKSHVGNKLITCGTAANYALFPDFSYISDIELEGCPYISWAAFHTYLDGGGVQEAVTKFNSCEYHENMNYFDRLEFTKLEMERLDQISDIKICPSILNKFQQEKSFYTHNHPMMVIVNDIKEQLYNILQYRPRKNVAFDLVIDPSRFGPILPISDVVHHHYKLKYEKLQAFRVASNKVEDEWMDVDEMISRTFRTISLRERNNLEAAGLSLHRLSRQERRLLLELRMDMRSRINAHVTLHGDNSSGTGYVRKSDEVVEITFINQTKDVIKFGDGMPLGLRLQLWNMGNLIARDYCTYEIHPKSILPGDGVRFLVPIPYGFIENEGGGNIYLKFGLVQEGVKWLAEILSGASQVLSSVKDISESEAVHIGLPGDLIDSDSS